MRKLRGAASAGSTSGSSTANNSTPEGSRTPTVPAANGRTTEEALMDARVLVSLNTLKKLFNEYTHPREPLSEQERDAKLYDMLPLFCKVSEAILIEYIANNSPSLQVFSSCPANDMSEKFWDVVAFCQQVSRLMVSEIRKRARVEGVDIEEYPYKVHVVGGIQFQPPADVIMQHLVLFRGSQALHLCLEAIAT